jgi:hypothetical protein
LPTDCFDLETNEWSVHKNIPHGRAGSSYGTTCDGKLILAGGDGFGQAFANVDVFDARDGSGLAVDCACLQIYLASGAATQGGAKEIASVETFFHNGTDVACLRSLREFDLVSRPVELNRAGSATVVSEGRFKQSLISLLMGELRRTLF